MNHNHINHAPNLQELFKYIARYKPKTIELDSQLKPFLPDYLPAIGDLDPFLKVGRPDQERDILGLVVSICVNADPPTYQLSMLLPNSHIHCDLAPALDLTAKPDNITCTRQLHTNVQTHTQTAFS